MYITGIAGILVRVHRPSGAAWNPEPYTPSSICGSVRQMGPCLGVLCDMDDNLRMFSDVLLRR